MKIYAIGDLHLSGRQPKPMNIFGENWTGHFERIRKDWREKVREEGDVLVAMTHYPPFSIRREDTLFTELFESHGVSVAVFGHLHGGQYFPLCTEKNGVTYHLVSCDKRAFTLTQIFERNTLQERSDVL